MMAETPEATTIAPSAETSAEEVIVSPKESGPIKYPKDYEGNVDYRLRMLLKLTNNKKMQMIVTDLCKEDILWWCNSFLATYNPRKNPSNIPFITYDYEDKLILDLVDSIRNQKDILIEKSRDMGVTWCVLMVFTWFWQFHGEGYDFLVGSRKEQYIDGIGNMDTLMEKVRFLIRNQPKWMRPQGFKWESDSNYMKIINPHSKATITGEATNNNFSRSGRRRAVFFDEFAFWECDSNAWRASADATNCRIVVSTPCGFNNQFAKLRHSGSIPVKTLHWTLHPEKDKAWYENECKRRNNDAVEIAQELDINYEGSEEGVLFEFAELKKAVSNEPLLSPDRIVISLDPAGEGEDEAVFYVSNNGQIIERKFIAKSNDPQLATESIMLITKHKAQVFISDSIGNSVADLVVQLLGKNELGVKVVKFDSRKKSIDPGYFNDRDRVYGEASRQMKAGLVQVDEDYTLQRQLNATKYKKDNGKMYVMAKEEIKAVVGSSPDRADSWVLMVEALKYTHSAKEVRQHETYRQVVLHDEVLSGEEYGKWGDVIE